MALTRNEIRRKIDNLTWQKNQYIKERDDYKKSLTHAKNLLKNLKDSNIYLESSNDYMKRFFTINRKTADAGKIANVRIQIVKISKQINTIIIPNINTKISDLNTKISTKEREIGNLWWQYENATE